jgi:hypothetical protein
LGCLRPNTVLESQILLSEPSRHSSRKSTQIHWGLRLANFAVETP